MENLKNKTIPVIRINKQKAQQHQVKKPDHAAENGPMSYRNHSHISTSYTYYQFYGYYLVIKTV
jgi:hypothetical protein